MGKRKNQQQKRKKAGNLSLSPTAEWKSGRKNKNTTMTTDKKIHSSTKDCADITVLKSNVTQPLNDASVLDKNLKSTNMENVISPEIMESKALKGRFPKNKSHTFQDTVQEELLDFFGSHNSDHNKCDKAITQNSKSVGRKSASDQTNEVKHKSKSHVNYSAAPIQDFEKKTVGIPLKENTCVNNITCIFDENASNAISGVKSGYQFLNEKSNFKAQHPKEISNTASKLQNAKSDSLYVKDYEIQKNIVDATQKENNLNIETYVPDKYSLHSVSFYQPHYEYSNKLKASKSQISNKIAIENQKVKQTMDTMQKGNSLIAEKYVVDKNSSCSVSFYQPHYEYSNKLKALKSQNSNKIVNESQKIKQIIFSSVNAFKESNYNFDEKYRYWKTTRMQTLQHLKELVRNLHDDQLTCNKAQKACREIGCNSRLAKPLPSTLGYIASVSAFLSDAASGITSAVQAVNVDMYSKKFEEIMKLDTEATKDLYNARSRCIVEYQGIEEVMRMYQSPTFSSTVSKISNDLELKKFWMDVSNAYENEDASKMLSVVGNFLESGSQFKVLQKIGDSIVTYVDENPAALEVCNSICRAARGAVDSLFIDTRQATLLSAIAHTSNKLMILDDKKEIARLSNVIDGDSSQSKLEDKIHDAIDSLQFEMEQITHAYIEQLPISDSYCDYDSCFGDYCDYDSCFGDYDY